MTYFRAACAAIALLVAGGPAAAQEAGGPDAVLAKHGFEGSVLVSGGRWDGYARDPDTIWPFASVTKQVVATLVMQQVEAGRLALDVPVDAYLRDWPRPPDPMAPFERDGEAVPEAVYTPPPLPAPTLRQLLRHQSGLYDPETDPSYDWSAARPIDPMMCVARRSAPGESFAYNNCDTLLVGKILEEVTGERLRDLILFRVTGPAGMENTGLAEYYQALPPSPGGASAEQIKRYGAAGGLLGPARDLVAFDRALMANTLLSAPARAEMWRGDPQLGYTALGQWEFTAPLAGCDAPVRIVERRGAIPGYQARNFIAPERGMAVVMFTARSESDYDFGEPWSGSGLSFDIMSAAFCG